MTDFYATLVIAAKFFKNRTHFNNSKFLINPRPRCFLNECVMLISPAIQFSKLKNGEKAMKKTLQTFYSFCENSCVAMPTFQLDIHSIRLRTGGFSTQTDWFYSHQCNEPIFKVDKWGKSYEKSLQTFYSFCEKSCVAMATFQRHICSL